MNQRTKAVVLTIRITPSQYNLLTNISNHTKLKKSILIRNAISQWLQNAPPDMPIDLKIEITRENMQHHIETIKNLRWTYHQTRNAKTRIETLQKDPLLPPHTQQTITNLEQQIIQLQNHLDNWLKQKYKEGTTP